MKVVQGGVTAPQGFKANGLYCGLKRSGKLDLGLLVSDVPCVQAAVFTKNSIKAAPLIVSMKNIKTPRGRAVVVNSGNANCYTGQQGFQTALKTTEIVAKHLGVKPSQILVTSTGIIGRPLPFEKIEVHAAPLVQGLSVKGSQAFAQAIMTTDLVMKEIAVKFTLGGKTVVIGGCAKGSGMIEPNMATMLGFITTDAAISSTLLKAALKEVTERSFNSITVDGCMSTNDMVTLQANGLANNPVIRTKGKDYDQFVKALLYVATDLSKKIVLDGEGATKFITIHVRGALNHAQAQRMAKAVANSALVKTAAFGSNPNWGRVGAAIGSLGIKGVNEKTMKISFSPFDQKDISITVQLKLGQAEATVYTCDFSYEYVKINGEYN